MRKSNINKPAVAKKIARRSRNINPNSDETDRNSGFTGARKWCACEALKMRVRTYHRWQDDGFEDVRKTRIQSPTNQLTAVERQAAADCSVRPENRSLSPKQIVPRLADKAIYLASESTFYRLLRAEKLINQ